MQGGPVTGGVPGSQLFGASARRSELVGVVVLMTACATTRLQLLSAQPGGRGHRVRMLLELQVDQLLLPGPSATGAP
jgi:hypothetical protein